MNNKSPDRRGNMLRIEDFGASENNTKDFVRPKRSAHLLGVFVWAG